MEHTLTPLLVFIVLATLASPASAWAAGDPVRGKREFLRCAISHSADANVHKAGPSLATIYGRAAGTVERFTDYSEALRRAGIVWIEETLYAWLEASAAFVPGHSMNSSGLRDAGFRRDLIPYLAKYAGQHNPAP